MKVLPVIMCGGAGTRLFKEDRDNLPKQFIDFGGWTMFEKTLDRINSKLFLLDYTNEYKYVHHHPELHLETLLNHLVFLESI